MSLSSTLAWSNKRRLEGCSCPTDSSSCSHRSHPENQTRSVLGLPRFSPIANKTRQKTCWVRPLLQHEFQRKPPSSLACARLLLPQPPIADGVSGCSQIQRGFARLRGWFQPPLPCETSEPREVSALVQSLALTLSSRAAGRAGTDPGT